MGSLPPNTNLNLAIGLPLRNRAALSNFLEQVYDPASTNFHHYLTPDQFTEQFSPSLSDYQLVQDFARSNGLAITQTYSNRQLVDVTGSVSNIEKAFHINLLVYQHPAEPRKFFAPDTEPSVDSALPILSVSGLSDFTRPHPMLRHTNSAIRTPD
jgi:kumamolisin